MGYPLNDSEIVKSDVFIHLFNGILCYFVKLLDPLVIGNYGIKMYSADYAELDLYLSFYVIYNVVNKIDIRFSVYLSME